MTKKQNREFIGPCSPYGLRAAPGNAFILTDDDHTPWNARRFQFHQSRAEIRVEPHSNGTCYVVLEETTQKNAGGRSQTRVISFTIPADMWSAIKSHEPR